MASPVDFSWGDFETSVSFCFMGEGWIENWWHVLIERAKLKDCWEILEGANQTELLLCPTIADDDVEKYNLNLYAEDFGRE